MSMIRKLSIEKFLEILPVYWAVIVIVRKIKFSSVIVLKFQSVIC